MRDEIYNAEVGRPFNYVFVHAAQHGGGALSEQQTLLESAFSDDLLYLLLTSTSTFRFQNDTAQIEKRVKILAINSVEDFAYTKLLKTHIIVRVNDCNVNAVYPESAVQANQRIEVSYVEDVPPRWHSGRNY